MRYILLIFFFWLNSQLSVAGSLTVSINSEELAIEQYAANGEDLIIWIAPGYGTNERFLEVATELTQRGIEVWYVDIADSLFLTKNTTTMRSLDGQYVSGLIEYAYISTNKSITLVSRSYGSIPLLRGARLWQKKERQRTDKLTTPRLAGAILFSPEFYKTIPPLGIDPENLPIVNSVTIPLMIYQAGNRNNRWRLPVLLDSLRSNGAMVYSKVLKGVTGLFYEKDLAKETQSALADLPVELPVIVNLLRRNETSLVTTPLVIPKTLKSGFDSDLKPYKAKKTPPALDLNDAEGKRIRRDGYKGKVTLVNFWASWCGPCVEEIPSLNNLRTKMEGSPFELISVNYAESRETMRSFLDEVNVDFPVLMDSDGLVSKDWNVIVFPSTYVIGPDGKIIYGVNAAIHWDAAEVIDALDQLME